MVKLKNANFRHNEDGERLAEVMLYTDTLSDLPTEAADIDGLLDDDVLDYGSLAINMTTGKVAMFDGTAWNQW